MKKGLGFLIRFLLCGALLVLAAFFSLALYYRSNFPVNTWINGIYCTGKTVEQVNEELVNSSGSSEVVVVGAGGASETIEMSAADICPDYTNALQGYIKQQESVFWADSLWNASFLELQAERYTWSEERLRPAFEALDIVAEEQAKKDGVQLCYDEAIGYYLEDGNVRRLDTQKAYSYLRECLLRGETVVNLEAGGCYQDREDTARDRKQREIWQKIHEFADCGIVYDMGAEKIPLTADIMCGFLDSPAEKAQSPEGGVSGEVGPALDDKGNLILDKAAVRSWVEQLAAAYDTCNTEREFLSTRGDMVTVKYGTYGTRLDVEAEVKYLIKALSADHSEEEIHVPAYKQQGYARGMDDIGDTYIEVDMTRQHMYFYLEGELVLDTDVVTGDVLRHRETPEGIYYIYGKARNRVLRGPGYASPVKYWMPVYKGVGIHDATWRGSFGGEIYKTDGSHGCINSPLEIASKLYEMVEVGMPVVMFY